jgi:hypothetical protein
MWATSSPQHQFLRQAIHKLHGPRYHHHHPWLRSCLIINRKKGIVGQYSVIRVKSLKLGQSTTLCQSRDTFIEAIQGLNQTFSIFNVIFALLIFMFFPKENIRRYNLQFVVMNLGATPSSVAEEMKKLQSRSCGDAELKYHLSKR